MVPDAWLVQRIEQERRGVLSARLSEVFNPITDRLTRELPEMAWRDVQSAMVALGISTDKLRPADGRGATFNYVDARGGGRDPMMLFGPVRVVMPPKEPEESNVVDGKVRELPRGPLREAK